MANIFDYQFNIGGNLLAKMEGMIDSTGRFRAKIEDCNNWLGRLTNTFAAFDMASNYVEKINGVFSGITEAGAAAELQLMNLKTLFGGNAEAADDMYNRISEYGKVTPYDKAGLLEAQRTMMSFGMSGEAAFSTLQQIGDIAMGDSQKLQSLALAFAQMQSTGKLMGQDFNQMINAGFNPLNEISKATGKSVGELKEEMSKGKISVEMVSEAFRSATSEGGLFYGAIEAASETTAGKMASIQDSIEEAKVKIFNTFQDLLVGFNTLTQILVPISQIIPLFTTIGNGMLWIKGLQWGAMWSSVTTKIRSTIVGMTMYNTTLKAGIVASGGFRANILQATLAVARFATVGIWNAIKGIGAFVLSLVTGGSTSATFAGIASGAFGTFRVVATTACRAVGVAIKNIPIIGWVATAITALIAFGTYFWNTSAKFRAVLKGLWASFTTFFKELGSLASTVFGAIGDLIKAAFSLKPGDMEKALGKLKSGYANFGGQIGKAFKEAYDAEMSASEKEKGKDKSDGTIANVSTDAGFVVPPATDPTGGSLGSVRGATSSGGGQGVKNISVTIDKLVEKFEIHTTNLQGDVSKVKEMVGEALLSALNDVSLSV